MRCGKAKQLMFLMRSGELDDAAARDLRAHVGRCPRCAAEQDAASNTRAVVDAFRRAEPKLKDAAGMTQGIMRAVDAERLSGVRRRPVHDTGSLMFYRFRTVCSAASVIIVGVFFLQSYFDARRLESLESRMNRSAQGPSSERMLSANDLRTAADAAERIDILNPRQAAAVASDLGAAFVVMRTTSLGTTPEMERLRAKYPRLWALSLDRGLDAQTRKVLATEGKAFLKEVQELIELGGR